MKKKTMILGVTFLLTASIFLTGCGTNNKVRQSGFQAVVDGNTIHFQQNKSLTAIELDKIDIPVINLHENTLFFDGKFVNVDLENGNVSNELRDRINTISKHTEIAVSDSEEVGEDVFATIYSFYTDSDLKCTYEFPELKDEYLTSYFTPEYIEENVVDDLSFNSYAIFCDGKWMDPSKYTDTFKQILKDSVLICDEQTAKQYNYNYNYDGIIREQLGIGIADWEMLVSSSHLNEYIAALHTGAYILQFNDLYGKLVTGEFTEMVMYFKHQDYMLVSILR